MTKTALITGSSAGIGAEIAYNLSQRGIKVFLAGRNEENLIRQVEKVNAIGYLCGDLLDNSYCETLIEKATSVLGTVDILVNNAGAYVWSPIEKTNLESIDKIMELNLKVPYKLCSLAVPLMKKQKWGRIINIGSISGAVGEANASLYSASKAGLIGMTKALALELAEYGITVNVISPGWVKTDMGQALIEQEVIDEAEQLDMIPQKRWISPEEIASLVNYLVSEGAMGITGQSINMCAGLSLG